MFVTRAFFVTASASSVYLSQQDFCFWFYQFFGERVAGTGKRRQIMGRGKDQKSGCGTKSRGFERCTELKAGLPRSVSMGRGDEMPVPLPEV